MSPIGVVHLVRSCNDIRAFQSFISSYKNMTPGVDHDLIIIFKGFNGGSCLNPYYDLMGGLNYKRMFLPDEGFDIAPYLAAANDFKNPYFIFLNSFSVILHSGWLSEIYRHAINPPVGIVGATGSWQSHYTSSVNLLKKPPHFLETPRSFARRLVKNQMKRQEIRNLKRDFLPFPNYHIRTNAFMMSRELILSVRCGSINSKEDALYFESGKKGLTQQLLKRGLQPLVVGVDGKAYKKEQLQSSRTFRSQGQENLLVADNQTQAYEQAGEAKQKELEISIWSKD